MQQNLILGDYWDLIPNWKVGNCAHGTAMPQTAKQTLPVNGTWEKPSRTPRQALRIPTPCHCGWMLLPHTLRTFLFIYCIIQFILKTFLFPHYLSVSSTSNNGIMPAVQEILCNTPGVGSRSTLYWICIHTLFKNIFKHLNNQMGKSWGPYSVFIQPLLTETNSQGQSKQWERTSGLHPQL